MLQAKAFQPGEIPKIIFQIANNPLPTNTFASQKLTEGRVIQFLLNDYQNVYL